MGESEDKGTNELVASIAIASSEKKWMETYSIRLRGKHTLVAAQTSLSLCVLEQRKKLAGQENRVSSTFLRHHQSTSLWAWWASLSWRRLKVSEQHSVSPQHQSLCLFSCPDQNLSRQNAVSVHGEFSSLTKLCDIGRWSSLFAAFFFVSQPEGLKQKTAGVL